MYGNSENGGTSRRRFLGALAAGAGAVSVGALSFSGPAAAESAPVAANPEDPDSWFTGIKGKHRAVFDIFEPHGLFPFFGADGLFDDQREHRYAGKGLQRRDDHPARSSSLRVG